MPETRIRWDHSPEERCHELGSGGGCSSRCGTFLCGVGVFWKQASVTAGV